MKFFGRLTFVAKVSRVAPAPPVLSAIGLAISAGKIEKTLTPRQTKQNVLQRRFEKR